jgi:hypothetical protein
VTQEPTAGPVMSGERPIDIDLGPVIEVPGRTSKPAVHPAVASAGFALIGIGIAMIAVTLHYPHSYPAAVLPGWLLSGFGTGLALPTIMGSGSADLPPAASATGSAVVNMARQLGYSLGTAIVVAILGTAALSGSQGRALDTLWVAVGACGAGALVAFGLTPRQRSLVPVTTKPAQVSAPGRAA